jgi:DNA-binding NarL/FixJ family response regulator
MQQRATSERTAAGPTVLLIDDHTMFRHGVRQALVDAGIEVVGEASNGRAGVQLADELQPDVVVLDLHMPLMDGIEAAERMIERNPAARILMLTVSIEEDDVVDALTAGASGYVLKTAPPEEVVAAVRSAHAGETTISPTVAARLVDRLRATAGPSEAPDPPTSLTVREIEILRLIAAGRENHEIADELVISVSTAKNHVAHVLDKLGLQNRVQAAVYAVRAGIV